MSSDKNQAVAQLVGELLHALEAPVPTFVAVKSLAVKINPTWGLFFNDFLKKLLEHDEQVWVKLLCCFSELEVRHVIRYPREGFRVEVRRGERLDLYARFKALSPFAYDELIFDLSQTPYVPVIDHILAVNGFSAAHDRFAFLIRNSYMHPIWIEQLDDGPDRDGPYRSGVTRIDITV